MPAFSNPPRHENTYIIDPENETEMARLMLHDRLLTKGMGGLFPERSDFSTIHKVLDIAYGPGGWVLDVALLGIGRFHPLAPEQYLDQLVETTLNGLRASP